MKYSVEIEHAADLVQAGGIIIYPTETVFGLGCRPDKPKALQKIIDIKGRSAEKGLILIAQTPEQLKPYTAELSDNDWSKILTPQERPTTWIVTPSPQTSPLLTGKHSSIAIRITTHPLALALCQLTGSALVSTSANISGETSVNKAEDLSQKLLEKVDYLVPGNCAENTRPSRICELSTGKILRD